MLFEFCIYFIVLCVMCILFIIISSDTRYIKPEYAERLEYLNDMLVQYVAPGIALTALCLIPIVIVWGA